MVEKRRELWGCFVCGWSLQHATAVWLFVGGKGRIPAVLGKVCPLPGCRWSELADAWLSSHVAGVTPRLKPQGGHADAYVRSLGCPVSARACSPARMMLSCLAGKSGYFFGSISVFPMLLLSPVWEKISICGEVEHEWSPQHGVASSIETHLI